MNLQKIISELEAERERLDQAILALERLSVTSPAKRRGRPPRWLRDQIDVPSAAAVSSHTDSSES